MSARMLRRALREKEASELVNEESEEEIEERAGASSAGNIFGHLQVNSLVKRIDSLSPFEQESEECEVEEEDEEERVGAPSSSNQQQAPPPKPSRKTKKKKNGKGKKKGNSDTLPPAAGEEDEAILKMLEKISLDAPAIKFAVKENKQEIFCTDPKYLKPEEELRHIFGSKVVNSVNRSNQAASQKRRNPFFYQKKVLMQPNPLWPKWSGGVSMELEKTTEYGIMYFRYVYSQSYMEIQSKFQACVETHDPHTIAALLAIYPYHVDSLLSLTEVYMQVGEHQNASALLERCLYSLECAWHPMFNPLSGKCRLDYSVPENKPLYQALFRHMQHLGRRGCHRTALEVAKLLFSLDPNDPTGVKLALDYYAIRSGQYAWLEAFGESFYDDKLLPNFSFSLAIARFHVEKNEEEHSDAVPSSELLQQALMLHPLVLKKIIVRAPIKEDAEWSVVLKAPLFARATAGGPSLEHLIKIYVERNFLIWRYPELQAWLKAAAKEVVKKPESGGEAASWACARAEAFPADYNEFRHLLVSDYSDTVSALPPDEPENIPENHAAAAAVDVNNLAELLQDRNPLSVFLESVLPWTNYGSPDRLPEEDNEHHIERPE